MQLQSKIVLGSVCAVLIGASATLASATANSSPARTSFAQGVHITSQTDGGFDESQVPGYESWLGHNVPLVEVFGDRSNESVLQCPTYALDPETAAKQDVIISWDFFNSSNKSNETWAAAAHGSGATGTPGVSYDQRYKAFGQCLVNHGQPNAIIRVAQEFNNGTGGMPGVYANDPTAIANFKLAFRTFVTDMRSISGANFTFDYNPSIDPGDPTDLTYAYPGDKYVDVIGLDSYDAAAPWGQNATSPQDQWNRRLNGYNGGKGIAFYNNFAKAHNKPISFPEWGLGWYYNNNGAQQTSADDAYYIQQMYNFMSTNNVLYESFWEDYNRGLYTARSGPTPTASKTFQNTFGAEDSAPWPNTGGSSDPSTVAAAPSTPVVTSSSSTPAPVTSSSTVAPVTSSTSAAPVVTSSTTSTPIVTSSSSSPAQSTSSSSPVPNNLSVSTAVSSGMGTAISYNTSGIGSDDVAVAMLTTGTDQPLQSIPAGWHLVAGYPVKSQTWGSEAWLFAATDSSAVQNVSTWTKNGGDAWVLDTAIIHGGAGANISVNSAYAAWTQSLTPRTTDASGLQIAFVSTLHNGTTGAAVRGPANMAVGKTASSYNHWSGHSYAGTAFTRLSGAQTAPTLTFPDPGANPIVSLISVK